LAAAVTRVQQVEPLRGAILLVILRRSVADPPRPHGAARDRGRAGPVGGPHSAGGAPGTSGDFRARRERRDAGRGPAWGLALRRHSARALVQ
jgi:hypothetical protein